MVMEVAVTDTVDAVCVTDVFDVDLALDDQLLNLILINFSPRFYGGGGGGGISHGRVADLWQCVEVVFLLLVVACCGVFV